MAIYLVGDIQGCFNELNALLLKVNFNQKKDTLYVAGDLVARGPDSLKTLRFIKSLGKNAKVVLGNHDLHLLAVHAGIRKPKPSDQLSKLLSAPDLDELMDWLAQQPLIQKIPNSDTKLSKKVKSKTKVKYSYMTHAGISPQWRLEDAIAQAKFIHKRLASMARKDWLSLMYGEEPSNWLKAKTEEEIFRYSINALTRMRYCYLDGSLEFIHNKSPEQTKKNTTHKDNKIVPWYELSKAIDDTSWVFGHWASLMGKSSHNNIFPLDTGCVWGNHLTMLRWHDKKYFTQEAIVSD